MFSLEKFYRDAYEGNQVNTEEFCDFLKSFEDIVIWGAGNLGTAVGKKIQELGFTISAYWDANYEKIGFRNGVQVIKTYEGGFSKENTLIVFCIANVPVSPRLFQELKKNGWKKDVRGLAILEGLICPFTKENKLDTGFCNSMDICTVCSCDRLSNIMRHKVAKERNIKEDEVLSFDRIHFIINNFCNLKCTHCFMYMNSYPAERKRNVDMNTMKRDIDMLFDAIDSLGVVNVFGGEPFLHPDLSEITKNILEKNNFGSVIINTNGLANIKEKQLDGLEDKRVRLAFSNYVDAITEEQQEKFQRNVETAENKGITVRLQNQLPTWNVSSTLGRNRYSEEELKLYKKRCGVKFLYVHNGRLYPCAMSLSINDLGVADYTTDYIDISKCVDAQELREKIIELVNRDCYQTCMHCDQTVPMTTIAGAQGYDERYSLKAD